jgi:hypothetical protein
MKPITDLADLLTFAAEGLGRLNEDFARGVARTLAAHAHAIALPAVERLGLKDVVVTFYMDKQVHLVVTGNLHPTGEVTVRWGETDFPTVEVAVEDTPRADPYTFATLDFSLRGRRATLNVPVPPLGAGLEVTVRALSTIDDLVAYRVVAHGVEVSVSPENLRLLPG